MINNFRVRAREKPLAEMPEWAICCETVRQSVARRQAHGAFEVVAIFPALLSAQNCQHCGTRIEHVMAVRTACKLLIPVDCLEFDEGLYRGCNPVASSGRGSKLYFSWKS
jgi:hypothetical protein